ncbi:MAG: hypothetical protein K2M07_04835 [Muribaculaceae bacterium]|nr:hypothetical protein [Muribaculaceae bacterium]
MRCLPGLIGVTPDANVERGRCPDTPGGVRGYDRSASFPGRPAHVFPLPGTPDGQRRGCEKWSSSQTVCSVGICLKGKKRLRTLIISKAVYHNKPSASLLSEFGLSALHLTYFDKT